MSIRTLLISGLAVLVFAVVPVMNAYAQTPAGGGAGGNTPAGTGTGGNTPAGTGAGANTPAGTGAGTSDGVVLQNPLNNIHSLPDLLNAILSAVIELGGILLTIMLIYVGFLFVMAQGNPEEISRARSALIWVLIGGLILLGAKGISLVIQETVKSL